MTAYEEDVSVISLQNLDHISREYLAAWEYFTLRQYAMELLHFLRLMPLNICVKILFCAALDPKENVVTAGAEKCTAYVSYISVSNLISFLMHFDSPYTDTQKALRGVLPTTSIFQVLNVLLNGFSNS